MIFYLVYISSAKELYTDADLSDILIKSQSNNKALDLTGMLLYQDGNILQLLEGDEQTVMNLYYKIEQDNRHSNITKMLAGTIAERNFPDWSMGFKTITALQWDEYAGYLRLDPLNIFSKLKNADPGTSTLVKSFITVNTR